MHAHRIFATRQLFQRAWFRLVLFGVLLSLFCSPGVACLASKGSQPAMFAWLMIAAPGLSALITKWIFDSNLRGFGWYPGRVRYLLFGCFCPLIVSGTIYGAIWWSGAASFSLTQFLSRSVGGFGAGSIPVLTVMGFVGTGGAFFSLASAFGQELGWRGFLVPLLAERNGFASVVWVSWALWYAYQLPMLLFANHHGRELFELLALAGLLFAFSVILAWLRLASGSLWPPAIFHAGHNLLIQFLFDPLTQFMSASGELSGGLALGYLVVAILVFFGIAGKDWN